MMTDVSSELLGFLSHLFRFEAESHGWQTKDQVGEAACRVLWHALHCDGCAVAFKEGESFRIVHALKRGELDHGLIGRSIDSASVFGGGTFRVRTGRGTRSGDDGCQ